MDQDPDRASDMEYSAGRDVFPGIQLVQSPAVSKPPLRIKSSQGICVGVLVGVEVVVGVAVDVGVKVPVGVSVGVLVGVVVAVDVGVMVDVGVEVLVGVSVGVAVGVLVGVVVAVPVAVGVMVLTHIPHVAADMLAGAAGLHPVLALPSLAPSGAASTLVDSRDRNIAISASPMIALFVLIVISFRGNLVAQFSAKTANTWAINWLW